MKITYNFNAFLRNFHFLFIIILWLTFPIRKNSKNNNFKDKTSMFRMEQICGNFF